MSYVRSKGGEMLLDSAVVTQPMLEDGPNEDAYVVQTQEEVPFIVVADGHGSEYAVSGNRLARSRTVQEFAAETATTLAAFFRRNPNPKTLPRIFNAADDVLSSWEDQLVRAPMAGLRTMGAAVSAITVWHTKIHLAQVGDCRLYRLDRHGLHLLTRDHHPDHPGERERLEPFILDRHVSIETVDGHQRVTAPDSSCALMMTRAIGDWGFGRAVTHVPEIRTFPLNPHAIYLLSTDGGTAAVQSLSVGLHRTPVRHVAAVLQASFQQPTDDSTIVLFRQRVGR
jgi:serine/threonine protein phosphatase PrpC